MLYSTGMNDRFFENWTTQLRKGLLEFCVLNAIRGGRIHGYDIAKRLSGLDGLVTAEGTVYPILSRFKQQALVRSTVEESTQGPPRKCYELTERGRKVLSQMGKRWDAIRRGIAALDEE